MVLRASRFLPFRGGADYFHASRSVITSEPARRPEAASAVGELSLDQLVQLLNDLWLIEALDDFVQEAGG